MVSEITGQSAVILAVFDSWQTKEPPLLDAAAFSFFSILMLSTSWIFSEIRSSLDSLLISYRKLSCLYQVNLCDSSLVQ